MTATEMIPSRVSQVGRMGVRRALPTRTHRTVGAWCFADHFGPAELSDETNSDIGPHPHIGLQTVTWLWSGEMVHTDSLGSEQPIRPGQLNLMTAGHGIAHAEEAPTHEGQIHGMQLWVAQPSATRDGASGFEHHASLPQVTMGSLDATVMIGSFADLESPARRDTDHAGVELTLHPGTVDLPANPSYEYAVIVGEGALEVAGNRVSPGQLLYLGDGRDELRMRTETTTRLLLLGGVPFNEQISMWWNFVARTHDEIDAAYEDWATDSGRFGAVPSHLGRISTPPPPWYQAPK